MSYRAVDSAEVSPEATIGDGTSLWHLARCARTRSSARTASSAAAPTSARAS